MMTARTRPEMLPLLTALLVSAASAAGAAAPPARSASLTPPARAATAGGAGAVPPLTFDHYYDQEAVTEALQALAKAHPGLCGLTSLGRSVEGRDIWLLTITNRATGADRGKPGIYVDGAIHGNEIQATEVCLYLAWYLLVNHGRLATVTDLVDACVFYIVPTLNVDSRTRFFTEPGGYNIGRTALRPFDDDRDGLLDEDGPSDLDGDGQILQMRVRDPFGPLRSDPEDPRLMIPVRPGEPGEWTLLGLEGRDDDGDGRVNEDPPGYLDLNRNWGFAWQPSYLQAGAGDYPFSEPNTWAIGRFLAAHPNICFAFAFHNYGGLWVRGPGSQLSPPYDPEDVAVYDFLGQEGERVVPGYRYIIGGREMYTTYGDFDEFTYQCWGIYGFVGELFRSGQERYRRPGDDADPRAAAAGPGGERGRATERERQRFSDRLLQGEAFAAWRPFAHPQYGEIEIGGWRPFTTRLPAPFQLLEMVHRNAAFVIWTAAQAPRVSLEIVEVKALGGDLWRVRARAVNAGGLPTLSAQARRRGIVRLDRFQLEGRGLTVVAGGVLEDPWLEVVTPVERRPERIPTFVPAYGKRDVQWIVAGRGRAAAVYDGLKTGLRRLEFELR